MTPLESSDLYPVTAGILISPGGYLIPSLIQFIYIYQLPTVVKHSLMVEYADDHTLLKIISDKSDRVIAASQLSNHSVWPW